MAKEIFDQERPRSTMARRLDEAFAGCEEWTIAPPSQRRSGLDVAPWLTPHSSNRSRRYGDSEPQPRAA
jgi:hypothetical protein